MWKAFRRALVLDLVPIAGSAIEQAPSISPLDPRTPRVHGYASCSQEPWPYYGREIGGRCKSYYFVLTLVRVNHILVGENQGKVRDF